MLPSYSLICSWDSIPILPYPNYIIIMAIWLIVVSIKAIKPVSQLQNTQLFNDSKSIIANLSIVFIRTDVAVLDYFHSP